MQLEIRLDKEWQDEYSETIQQLIEAEIERCVKAEVKRVISDIVKERIDQLRERIAKQMRDLPSAKLDGFLIKLSRGDIQ